MTEPKDSQQSQFQRILDRVQGTIASTEQRTWETIQEEIEEAVELEAAAAEMTREELSLLGAYLRRDLQSLRHYIRDTGHGVREWLKFDAHPLEDKLVDLLFLAADKTTIEQMEFEQELADLMGYSSGQWVIAGTLACSHCGAIYEYAQPQIIMDCLDCGGDTFKRVVED